MAKFPTFPTLYDEVIQLNISKLKEWEYLNTEQIIIGTITWSKNGTQSSRISIQVNTQSKQPYIELVLRDHNLAPFLCLTAKTCVLFCVR